jgi:TolB protein
MARNLTVAASLVGVLAFAGLAAPGPAQATYPGRNGRLVFGSALNGAGPDIYSVRADGHGLRRLTTDPGFDACAAASADGRYVAWCHGPNPSSVWVMKQNGTGKRQLTDFGVFPDFSPDGSKVAFTGQPPGAANFDLYVVNIDGSGLTQLTTDPGFDGYPAWSPDGRTIAFNSDRTGIPQVWLMDPDGSHQRQLTFDGLWKDQLPDWRPDGSQIGYVADQVPDSGGDIWLINSDGSDPHPITSGQNLFGVAWSPDGTKIATVSALTRNVNILNADGTGMHALHPPGLQFVPAWQPLPTGTPRP